MYLQITTLCVCSALILLLSCLFLIIKTYVYKKNETPAAFASLLEYAILIDNNSVLLKNGDILSIYEILLDDLSLKEDHFLQDIKDRLVNIINTTKGQFAFHYDFIRYKSFDYHLQVNDLSHATFNNIEKERQKNHETNGFYKTKIYLSLCYKNKDSIKKNKVARKILNEILAFSNHKSKKEAINLDDYYIARDNLIVKLNNVISLRTLDNITVDNLKFNETLSFLNYCICKENKKYNKDNVLFLDNSIGNHSYSHGTSPKIDDKFIAIIAIDGLCNQIDFNILNKFNKCDFEFRFNTRFITFDNIKTNIYLEHYRRLWAQKSRSLLSQILNIKEGRVNKHAKDQVEKLDNAKSEFDNNETVYGSYSANFIIMHQDLKKLEDLASCIVKELDDIGFNARIETINATEAFLGSLPGHTFENVRAPLISSKVLVNLLPLSIYHRGSSKSSNPNLQGSPALLLGQNEAKEPYYLNLHVKDLGHSMIIGPTGSGKSYFLKNLILNTLRYKNSKIFTFDKDSALSCFTKNLNGNFINLSGDKAIFCPFENLNKEHNLSNAIHFLELIVRLSFTNLDSDIQKEITTCINLLKHNNENFKSLSDFINIVSRKDLKLVLEPYLQNGQFPLLDAKESLNLKKNRINVFECGSLFKLEDKWRLPTLFQIFSLIENSLSKDHLSLIVLDEAWLMLKNETFFQTLIEWLKTFRKYNAFVVLATQSVSDISMLKNYEILLECLASRIFLPNYQALNESTYNSYKRLDLSDKEIFSIKNHEQKKDYLLKNSNETTWFSLNTTPSEHKLLISE